MNVELSERARKRVEQLVEEGEFASADLAVEAALELLHGPERELSRDELAALLAPGFADIEAGRVFSGDEALRQARALLEAKAQPKTQ